MTSIPTKRMIALAACSALGLTLAGCGGESGLQAMPENAPYVQPPSPGEMKLPPKQKGGKPRGVPLSMGPGARPADVATS